MEIAHAALASDRNPLRDHNLWNDSIFGSVILESSHTTSVLCPLLAPSEG